MQMNLQTAVWSGSALFAQTCLTKNLGSFQNLNSSFYFIRTSFDTRGLGNMEMHNKLTW